MTLEWAALLGLVQGLTEFLPISSSAHLRLFGASSAFTAAIQLGTLLAVFVYFRSDVARYGKALIAALSSKEARQTQDAKLALGTVYGTIPICVLGLLLHKFIENNFRSYLLIGLTFLVGGILMLVAEVAGRKNRGLDSVGERDGIFIGLMQCLALIPGMSRSGATISGGFLLNLDREASARYSFLLSIPAILISGLYQAFSARKELFEGGATNTIVATVVAFVVGLISIDLLLKVLRHRYAIPAFVVYRWLLGATLVGLVLSGHLDPMQGHTPPKPIHVSHVPPPPNDTV